MMATEPRVLTLDFPVDPNGDLAAQIFKHVGVTRYLDAGYVLAAHGTKVVRGRAVVPLIVPDDQEGKP